MMTHLHRSHGLVASGMRYGHVLVAWVTALVAALAAAPAPAAPSTDASAMAFDIRPLLEDIAVRAIEHGPMVRQSSTNIEAAVFDLDEARGRRWPQIDLGMQSTLANPPSETMPKASSRPVATLSATTTLFDWGRNVTLIGAAESGLEAAKARYDATVAAIAAEACAGFIDLARKAELTVLADRYVSEMAAVVDMLVQIVAVDAGRESELIQARARLLQARSLHELAQSRQSEAQIALRKLIGDALPPLPTSARWDLPPPDLSRALDSSRQDPAVLAANAEIRAAEQRADAIKASGMPALNLTISRPLNRDAFGRPPGWQAGLALTMPLSRGGSIDAAAGAARERARSESWRRDQLLLDLEYRIRNAHHEAHTTSARALSYADLSVELKKVRDNFFDQWLHLGRRSLLDVLNAQSEHYGNEVNAVSSRYEAYIANIRLRTSAGQLVPWLRGDTATP